MEYLPVRSKKWHDFYGIKGSKGLMVSINKNVNQPLCQQCGKNFCTVNYVRNGVTYYRTTCFKCMKKKKKDKSLEVQALIRSGYQKRPTCDRCGFHAKHPNQLSVVFLDGNRLNVDRLNLRTYCANCIAELSAMPKRKSSLVPDF